MHAAALRVELRLPAVRSLKEKRSRIKTVTADLQRAFNVAVSEVDHQDLWQRGTLGMALVAPSAGHLERIVHRLEKHLARVDTIEVLSTSISYLEDPD